MNAREKIELCEKERIQVLKRTIEILKEYFHNKQTEVFLIGSVIVPGVFYQMSEVCIVLKNFQGNLMDISHELETKINRKVKVISYEQCSPEDQIDKRCLRVL